MDRNGSVANRLIVVLRPFLLPLNSIVLLLCLAGLWQCALKPGLGSHWEVEDGEIRATDTSGWVQKGDKIVAFEGITTSDSRMLELLLDGHQIGDQVVLDILRGGLPIQISSTLTPYYSQFYLIVISLIGILFFSLGLLVVFKCPHDDPALTFHLTMNCVALMVTATSGAYHLPVPGLGEAVRVAFTTAYALMPTLFLHFTFLFPERRSGESTALTVFYGIALLISLTLAIAFLCIVFKTNLLWWGAVWCQLFDFCRVVFGIGCLLSIVSFIYSYRIAFEETSRRKLRWLLLGSVAGLLPFIGLWLVPDFLGSQPIVSEGAVILASGITPITFAIAIIRHRLMDIDLILKRSTVYAVMIGLWLVIYLGIIGSVAALLGSLTVRKSLIASIASAVIVALLFDPVRRRVQAFVDRRFFRVGYNYRRAQRMLAEEANRMVHGEDIARYVVDKVSELIPVERIGMFAIRQSDYRVECMAEAGFELLRKRTIPFDLEELNWTLQLPVVLEEHLEPGVPVEKPDRKIFNRWGVAAVFLTLSEGGKALGFLAVGPKKSGGRFTVEDIDLLSSVATQSGFAVERLALQRKLILERAESERLEELNRMKSYFVSSVTHELKTPLTSIRLFAELLRNSPHLSSQKEEGYLCTIEEQTERLSRLIDNVLDFAKIERGVKDYRFVVTDLNSVVQSALTPLLPHIKRRGFTLQVTLEPTLPPVPLDHDAVIEALTNLFDNSVKYSVDRRYLGVTTFLSDQYVGIAVKDHGIGISLEDRGLIFDPFYRVRDPGREPVGGTGLGLALVKEVMDVHQGLIEMQSVPGDGTTITLLFPSSKIIHQ